MRRGGGSDGVAGLTGSAGAEPFRADGAAVFFVDLTAVSEKMSPFGNSMPR
jgi:hypothetical protein